jgi:hypothetical protein
LIVSLYSPLPPARTGVADYSAALVRALSLYVEVKTNPDTPLGVPLYHVGNNRMHEPIYRRALDDPGYVVLHDAVLQHFFLGILEEQTYVEEFTYNYGDWYRALARRLWRERARSAQDERYFSYPMLRRVVERSHGVIVHNPAAAGVVRAHSPNAHVVEIPHLWEPPPLVEGWEVERLRHSLGVPPGGLLFGVFGHLRESKRLMAVLHAFHWVQRHHAARLLLAGDFVSRDLARAVEAMDPQAGVVRVPYLSERDFWLHAAAVDACINLRFPAAGETSGITIRLMGLGKAVLLSTGEESAQYPQAACLRVDTGVAEQEMLEAYLAWLCQTPGAAAAIGSCAAQHVRTHHDAGEVARRYVGALELTERAETR